MRFSKEEIITMEVKDIARYFLSKDKENKLFTKKLINLSGKDYYEGNVRLNKYLYLAQTLHLAKYGSLLFEDNIIAHDSGCFIKEVMNDFFALLVTKNNDISLDEKIRVFLDKIYKALEKANCNELIEIWREDTAWKELNPKIEKNPVIDVLKYKEKYVRQYKGIIKVMKI